MRVASVIDISLVDVPGIPVTVVFTGGCNFDCPYCQNASLIPMDSGDEQSIDQLVVNLDGFLSDGFCITGGEPTLQKDLPEFLKALKERIGGHINLNTQGSVPSILKKSLPYLDSVWFDIKASPKRYPAIVRTKSDPWMRVDESIRLVMDSSVSFWPRTTFVGSLLLIEDVKDIVDYLECLGFTGTYTIQNYVESAGVREDEKAFLTSITKDEMQEMVGSLDISFDINLEWR